MTSHEFFTRLDGMEIWKDEGMKGGKAFSAVQKLVDPSFVFLDGEHSAFAVETELAEVFTWDVGLVLVDNVDQDPATITMLQEKYDVTMWATTQATVRRKKKPWIGL